MLKRFKTLGCAIISAISAAPLLLLTACFSADPNSGAQTHATFKDSYDSACVDRALRSTIGVDEIYQEKSQSSDQTTDTWRYGGNLGAVLEISRVVSNGSASTEYFNSNIRMSHDLSRGKAFEPLMRRVNASIEKACHLPITATATNDIITQDGWKWSGY